MAYKPAYIWNGTSFDQIGNQAVASLNDYALLSPVVGQTITNTTLTAPLTTVAINPQTGTTYTLQESDRDKIVELNNSSAITVTLGTAADALPVGSNITILQTGAGQVTVVGSSVTVNSNPGLKLSGQWAAATLIKRASGVWVMLGNTAS